MDAKFFWPLMEDVCLLVEFIAGMDTDGAETNIVGTFRVIHDGIELVLERQDCGDHFHIVPEKIRAIQFGYCKNAIEVWELDRAHTFLNRRDGAKTKPYASCCLLILPIRICGESTQQHRMIAEPYCHG